MNEGKVIIGTGTSWRAINIRMDVKTSGVGWLRYLWGMDIWVQGIPILKVFAAANIAMWILLWITR